MPRQQSTAQKPATPRVRGVRLTARETLDLEAYAREVARIALNVVQRREAAAAKAAAQAPHAA